MTIISPLTGSTNIRKVKDIHSKDIVKFYSENLKIDVSKYFKGLENISIYECLDSGYKFYYPLTLAGGSEFYEQLQKYPWYYMDWKWEHQKALEILGEAKNLLEIGCGRGEFIEKVQKKGINCVGLELNEDAAVEGNKRGVKILNESIEDYSKKHQNEFDVVCSFQVVEHIANVGEFIKSSIDALKYGGKLIICVPNNDSFILKTDVILDMPPHHMGQWSMNSLIGLQRLFNMQTDKIFLEPLQSYHVRYANEIAEESLDTKLKQKHLQWIPFLKTTLKRLIHLSNKAVAPNIVGQSIMAVYIKK